jgi:lysozyme
VPISPKGLDLASYQGYPNWAAVAASGIAFAITKATEGVDYLNPTFAHNWAGMRANNVIRGAYHFGRPSLNGAVAEADHFADQVLAAGFEAGDLAVLDLEDTNAVGDLGDWTLDWLERATVRLGVKPLLYTGAWYSGPHQLESYPLLAEYGLWLAAYQGSMPAPPSPWPVVAIWQYTDTGQVPGIAGNVDLDVYNGDLATLRLYGKPEPVPDHVDDPAPDDELATLRGQVAQLQAEKAALISTLGYARGDVADALQAAVNTLRRLGA